MIDLFDKVFDELHKKQAKCIKIAEELELSGELTDARVQIGEAKGLGLAIKLIHDEIKARVK